MATYLGPYSKQRADALRRLELDRRALAARGQPYERLDQLTVDLLLGAR
jgi:xylose isomerase